ncbi:hypothetical protein [cyanobacterium endosymbiont of Epithemia clementina EcSB]|uniref:hypothetical protein n=1 Tax=cyanobacterium endosymbiont of Epithemia clementina EcSB TaxID=3034674 RepID=UPI00248192DC|nr:hypothetical protein [cyanobacterium endosymbiont of Epithemia clementina EcSB]WGT67243.1 hypothetical protein P3F56_08530 [cyanobacterium endosymbiont of Epithemia clementina EcSB]
MGGVDCKVQEEERRIPDFINGVRYLYKVYTNANYNYTLRMIVLVLWGKTTDTIILNKSSVIIWILNSVFDKLRANPKYYYSVKLKEERE